MATKPGDNEPCSKTMNRWAMEKSNAHGPFASKIDYNNKLIWRQAMADSKTEATQNNKNVTAKAINAAPVKSKLPRNVKTFDSDEEL